MKATAIEKILTELMADQTLNGLIEVHTANRMWTLNSHIDESGNEFKVDHDENILYLATETQGTAWIDCDCVTSIEV